MAQYTEQLTADWRRRLDQFSEKSRQESHPSAKALNAVAFSPNGAQLATAGIDGTARVWDIANASEILRLSHDDPADLDLLVPVQDVAFSRDGTRIATASVDGIARVWDVASGDELAHVTHDDCDCVPCVAFSPDGAQIATANGDEGDKIVRVWEISSGRELFRFTHEDPVMSVAFSPDGSRIATANGITHVTYVPKRGVLASLTGRTTTAIESQGYATLWRVE